MYSAGRFWGGRREEKREGRREGGKVEVAQG